MLILFNHLGLYTRMKRGWGALIHKKQVALSDMLRKKVCARVHINSMDSASLEPAPNQWQDSMEDLQDDSDFEREKHEVYLIFITPINVLRCLTAKQGPTRSRQGRQRGEVRLIVIYWIVANVTLAGPSRGTWKWA